MAKNTPYCSYSFSKWPEKVNPMSLDFFTVPKRHILTKGARSTPSNWCPLLVRFARADVTFTVGKESYGDSMAKEQFYVCMQILELYFTLWYGPLCITLLYILWIFQAMYVRITNVAYMYKGINFVISKLCFLIIMQ